MARFDRVDTFDRTGLSVGIYCSNQTTFGEWRVKCRIEYLGRGPVEFGYVLGVEGVNVLFSGKTV